METEIKQMWDQNPAKIPNHQKELYKYYQLIANNISFEISNKDDKLLIDELRDKYESLKEDTLSNTNKFSELQINHRIEKLKLKESMNDKIEEIRNEYINKLDNKTNIIESQQSNIYKSLDNIVDQRCSIVTEKMKSIQEKNEELKSENDILKKKYVSASKGLEFEADIFDTLSSVINTRYNNIWKISHISHVGFKGDILLEHKVSKIRIMLDSKNHVTVNVTNRTRFIDDITNKTNNYHGGVLISHGLIQTKQTFEKEVIKSKYIFYMSYYKMGSEDFLMTVIENLHQCILNSNSKKINIQ